MPDDAVMDVVETAPAEVEPTDVSEPTEPTEQRDQSEQPSEPADKAALPTKAVLVENGKPTEAFRQHLEKLKAENPALAAQIRNAVYKAEELARELPGGLKELRGLRETVETLGGENGIEEIQGELRGWHEFDEQFSNGDPKALDFMLSEPEGQVSFLKLMPTALAKYAELHPDGYGQQMSEVFVGDMARNGIPLALDRLQDFIADNPKAMEQWNKIVGYVNRLGQLSQKQVELPKSKVEQQPNSDIEQREANLTRTEWKNETAGEQRQIFQSEWDRNAAGRKISEAQSAAIKELFESRLNKALQSKHGPILERYFQARDKNGFMRYASSISKQEVPRALKAAFDAVMPPRPGPKPGTAPAAKTPQNGTPKIPVPGFVQITKQPPTNEIDMRHQFNTVANFQAGKAVLKDGRKVTWSK